jgi:hypothetical protein
MLGAYVRLVRLAVAASCVIPLIVTPYNVARSYTGTPDSASWDTLTPTSTL